MDAAILVVANIKTRGIAKWLPPWETWRRILCCLGTTRITTADKVSPFEPSKKDIQEDTEKVIFQDVYYNI